MINIHILSIELLFNFLLTAKHNALSSLLPIATKHQPPWTAPPGTTRNNQSIDRRTFSTAYDEQSHGSRALIREIGHHSAHSVSLTWNSLQWLALSFNTLLIQVLL